jgi:large subunit ribosomal protein L19
MNQDMDTSLLNKVEKSQYKKRPDVRVGDTVKLHLKIKEGEKERVQIFESVIIGIKGVGLSKTIIARKISYGIGVEKTIPLHSPILEKIEIVKRGTVGKSKLFYLRKRVGRRALKVGVTKDVYLTDDVEVPVVGESVQETEVAEQNEEK